MKALQWMTWIAAAVLFVVPASASAQTMCCFLPEVRTADDCEMSESRCLRVTQDLTATWSGEIRLRTEVFSQPDFGISGAPSYNAIASRALVGLNIRTSGGARAFFQLSAAAQNGRRPRARPFDESAPDIAQAFIELPIAKSGTLRLGRQELGLGNRLVALRDGVTLRRAFDAVRLDIQTGGSIATAFLAQPVFNKEGALDDVGTRGERFSGLSWQFPGSSADGIWTAYLFDRERNIATYAQVTGPEHRQTLGFRFAKNQSNWDVTAQFAGQIGKVSGINIRAYGATIDVGWRPGSGKLTRYGLSLGLASGDKDVNDKTLGTFDPLYPNLGAYTDAPLSYYSNQVNVQFNISHPFGRLVLRTDATLLARHRSDDALYAPPGRPLLQPLGRSKLSAVLLEASARWRVSPRLELYSSILRSKPLGSVEDIGGKATSFAMFQITTGF